MSRKRFFLFCLPLILVSGFLQAQDTTKRTIEITSSFKPVLRNAAKINFNATPPAADTVRPRFGYNIPSQNIIPALGPVSLKPLSYRPDSTAAWANSNFIKAGYGNLQTPYVEAGFSFPAGKSRLNLLADHISSSGKIDNQDYSRTGVKGFLNTPISDHLNFRAGIGFAQDKYYQYGYDHTKYKFNREDLLNRFSTITAEAGLHNPVPTTYGLAFHPTLRMNFFSDNRKNNESNAVLDAPLEKMIGNAFGIKLGFNADMTRYSPSGKSSISNNIFTVPLALSLRTPNLKVQAGITPSWDNGNFKFLPNFLIDVPVVGEKWVIQGGWISYFNKGSYQRFAGINPYLSAPTQLLNNRMLERFVGFKGTLLDHFTYNAKIGYAEFRNVPLFVNDTASGKSFGIIYEEQLKAMQIQGEFGIIQGEHLSLTTRINWYKYNEQRTEDRPWGLIPLEISANLRWNVVKDLWLTSDFFLWDGALYKRKNGTDDRSGGALDLNAGLEYRITGQFFLWTQFNNIFNSKYQRWNQYDNYGFNMLLGAIFRFNQ